MSFCCHSRGDRRRQYNALFSLSTLPCSPYPSGILINTVSSRSAFTNALTALSCSVSRSNLATNASRTRKKVFARVVALVGKSWRFCWLPHTTNLALGGQGYESTIIALEMALSIEAGMVKLQEPFIGTREISHSAFHFYWPQAERKEIRLTTAIRKELTDKIVIEYRTDFINHPYVILLEIRGLDPRSKKPGRKTRAVNVYDNRVGRGYTWEGGISRIRRALEDIRWESVICGRVLIAGDINAHSPI